MPSDAENFSPILRWEEPVVGELTYAQAMAEGLIDPAEASALGIKAAGIAHTRRPDLTTNVAPLEPPPLDRNARKTYFIGQIKDWIANRRAREDVYMAPEEIGRADDRPFLLQRALLDNVVGYYRQNPRTPAALGVLVIDTVLSDSREGCSTASAERVAKLLGCNEKYIRRARELLAKDRLLGRATHKGLSDRHWPILNRAFVGQDLHQTWWLDATSEPPAPRGNHSGKPRTKPRTSDVRPFADTEIPRTPDVRPLADKTPDIRTQNPGHQMSDEFTREFTDEDKRERAPEAVAHAIKKEKEATPEGQARQPSIIEGAAPTAAPAASPPALVKGNSGEIVPPASTWLPPELAQPLEDARRRWMRDPNGIAGGITHETVVASIGTLAQSFRAQSYADAVIRAGIIEAIGEMSARAIDNASDKGRSSGAAFIAYLTKVITSKVISIDKAARARDADIAETAAKTETTKVIQSKRVEAFDKVVAAGRPTLNGAGGRPHAGGVYVQDDQGATVFGPAAKFAPIAFNPITVQNANQVLREARKHLPEVAVQDVEEAFVEISDAFDKKRNLGRCFTADEKAPVPIKNILAKAVDAIRGRHAYAKHGTPEMLAGGAPAEIAGWYGDKQMKDKFIVIAQSTVNALLAKYPKAATNQNIRSSYDTSDLLKQCWIAACTVATNAGWHGYGPETQARAKEAFEQCIKESHDKAVRRDEENPPEVVQRWLEDQARERCGRLNVSQRTFEETVEYIRRECINRHGDVATAMNRANQR